MLRAARALAEAEEVMLPVSSGEIAAWRLGEGPAVLLVHSDYTPKSGVQRVRDIIGRPLEFYLGLKGAARDRRVVELLEMKVLMAQTPGLSNVAPHRLGWARSPFET